LDKARGGSKIPEVGQGRRNDKCNYPGCQEEEEDDVHHIAHQRGAGHEEVVDITYHCENIE
jgi:hypothetical protein